MEPELVQTTMEENLDHCVILAWNIHRYAFSLFITEEEEFYRGPEGSNCQAHGTRIKEYEIRNLTITISQKNPKNKTN
jgi:hypothetical protein